MATPHLQCTSLVQLERQTGKPSPALDLCPRGPEVGAEGEVEGVGEAFQQKLAR